MEFSHTPVLLNETVDALITDENGVYADGTTGGGGHSAEIARRLGTDGRLIAIDRDAEAVSAAKEKLEEFGAKALVTKGNFRDMRELLFENGILSVSGIVLDLGMSSHQIDDPERGFSYMESGSPLDMRMDAAQGKTAADVLNKYQEEELERILREYGEERFAGRIARELVKARGQKPFETAGDLNEAILRAIPAKYRSTGSHPSKRTFQAIRIEVNDELSGLSAAIDEMISLLLPGGRICIITFHSLEDRIVKNTFRKNENPCTCPKSFPVCVCGKKPAGHIVNKKPIVPSEDEIKKNRRAKSAKLRIFEKKA